MNLRQRFILLTGWLTLLSGLLWVIKAASILLSGYQPPLIFEIAPMLLACGLLGLYLRLGARASGWGKAGVALAVLAFFIRLSTTLYEATPSAIIPTGETFEFPYSLFVLIGAVGVFIGLILLGVDVWRARLFPSPTHYVPLTAGLLIWPLSVSGLLHLEIPVLVIGLLWIWVGYIILRVALQQIP